MSAHDPDQAGQVVEQLNEYIEEVHEHLEERDLIPDDEPHSTPPRGIMDPTNPVAPSTLEHYDFARQTPVGGRQRAPATNGPATERDVGRGS